MVADSDIPQEVIEKWQKIQADLSQLLIEEDCVEWQKHEDFQGLTHIAGVDVSFVKDSITEACAALVVCSYPDLEVVEEIYKHVELTVPYASGYLAFREVEFFQNCLEEVRAKNPEVEPQLIMVDGNGILHQRGFGVACHLGVLTDIPCIGVAKKLMQIDGLRKNLKYNVMIQTELIKGGDCVNLRGDSGRVWGKALRSCDNAPNPIFVSVGHKISLNTAVKVVQKCCKYRIPEPVRQADIGSREYLRKLEEIRDGPDTKRGEPVTCRKPSFSFDKKIVISIIVSLMVAMFCIWIFGEIR